MAGLVALWDLTVATILDSISGLQVVASAQSAQESPLSSAEEFC